MESFLSCIVGDVSVLRTRLGANEIASEINSTKVFLPRDGVMLKHSGEYIIADLEMEALRCTVGGFSVGVEG